MATALIAVIGFLFVLALILLSREMYIFHRWKQSLGRLDQNEWTRRLASIREQKD